MRAARSSFATPYCDGLPVQERKAARDYDGSSAHAIRGAVASACSRASALSMAACLGAGPRCAGAKALTAKRWGKYSQNFYKAEIAWPDLLRHSKERQRVSASI